MSLYCKLFFFRKKHVLEDGIKLQPEILQTLHWIFSILIQNIRMYENAFFKLYFYLKVLAVYFP